jgi:creatinine amidohydrolase
MEKHGPHLPLFTDLLAAREIALRAARIEYCAVFPSYYFGQIFEAKHQPGTLAYSAELIWRLLQETCDELGRNGFTRIILENGHGGNNNFLAYFCQAQMAERKPYAVVLFKPFGDTAVERRARALHKTSGGGHAGEDETSIVYALRPDLVHLDMAGTESGEDMNRLADLPTMFTGIWWYAKFPNHYSGDGAYASRELGELLIDSERDQLVRLIRSVKNDEMLLKLQQRFYDESGKPLGTRQ